MLDFICTCMFIFIAPIQSMYAMLLQVFTIDREPKSRKGSPTSLYEEAFRNDEKVVMPFRSTNWATVSKYCEERRKKRQEAAASRQEAGGNLMTAQKRRSSVASSQERAVLDAGRRSSEHCVLSLHHSWRCSSGSRFYAHHLSSDNFEESHASRSRSSSRSGSWSRSSSAEAVRYTQWGERPDSKPVT
eukprot:517535-Hanusia_phi.AAC.2